MHKKCYKCSTLLTHHFSDCVSVECSCACVKEIYSMGANQKEDEMEKGYPNFLNITAGEIPLIPSLDKEIRRFNLINRDEWTKTKKDRRFKKR